MSARKLANQEDTVISGVTLNFMDCASIFVSSVKNLSIGQFMIEGRFQMHFHPAVGPEVLENVKGKDTSGKNAFFIVRQNLHNNFLFECVTFSAK